MSSLKQLKTDWLEDLELAQGRSVKTVANYDHYLSRFLLQQAVETVDGITLDAVREFRRYLAEQFGVSPATQNYHLIALRQFLKYLARRDIAVLAAEKIGLAALPEREVDVLYPEEIDALLAAPRQLLGAASPSEEQHLNTQRDIAILETLFSTGMRISELVRLDRDTLPHAVREGTHESTETAELSIRGKGNKLRVVFLSPASQTSLRTYIAARTDMDPALFIRHKKGAVGAADDLRLTPRSVQRAIKKYAALAGLTKQVTPHTLRHCLHEDTRIVLNPDVLSARTVLEKKKTSVLSFDFEHNKLVRGTVIRHFSHESTPLVQIWASGRELLCSPEHSLFTVSESGVVPITAGELQPGMFVAGIKSISYRGTKVHSLDFWRLVGYIIGDGTLSEARRGIIINEKDKRFVDFYAGLVERVTGRPPTVKPYTNGRGFALNIYNVQFLRELRALGITQYSPRRRLPTVLFKATTEEIGACLAGLYDAEGNTGTARIFSTSKDLLKDAQLALLRLKIDSFINTRVRRVKLPQGKVIKNTIYILHILQKPSQEQFRRLVPTLKKITILPRNVDWKLPTQPIIQRHYRLARQAGVTRWGLWLYGIKYLARYKELCTTPSTLKKIILGFTENGVDQSVTAALKQVLALSNVKWLKIHKVSRYQKPQKVFDFTVLPYSNLITDGFISHNSFATDLLASGADVRQVQQLLGHASITTTQAYTHITDAGLRDVHEQFHRRRE